MKRTFRQSIGIATVLMVAAAVTVGLVGCGSSSSSSGSSTSTGEGREAEAGTGTGEPAGGPQLSGTTLECLEEHGVEPPGEGETPRGGAPPAGFQEAAEECGVEAPPQGAGGEGRRPLTRKGIESFVACVRRHGYQLPEPNLSGEGPVFEPSEVDQSDPKFRSASRACQGTLQ